MKFLKILLTLSLVSLNSYANSDCSATPYYNKKGKYAGCTTNVNGHRNFSSPTDLTELGCISFCRAIDDTYEDEDEDE